MWDVKTLSKSKIKCNLGERILAVLIWPITYIARRHNNVGMKDISSFSRLAYIVQQINSFVERVHNRRLDEATWATGEIGVPKLRALGDDGITLFDEMWQIPVEPFHLNNCLVSKLSSRHLKKQIASSQKGVTYAFAIPIEIDSLSAWENRSGSAVSHHDSPP